MVLRDLAKLIAISMLDMRSPVRPCAIDPHSVVAEATKPGGFAGVEATN